MAEHRNGDALKAGLIGAAAGAAIGAAVATIFSDEKKRKKLEGTMKDLRDRAMEKVEELKAKSQKMQDTLEKEMKDEKEHITSSQHAAK